MKEKEQVICPVDFVPINENKARVIASLVFITSVAFIFSGSSGAAGSFGATAYWPLIAVLAVDFSLRAFGYGKISLLGFIAGGVVKLLSLGNKPVDQGPKRFAAGVGIVFSVLIVGTSLTGLQVTALVLAGVLSLFSFLEASIGFCAGCLVYSLLRKVLPI